MMTLIETSYPFLKAFHLLAVMGWMSGLFYLPRLYGYHAEQAAAGSTISETFKIMEMQIYLLVMTPAMILTWVLGLVLISIPGLVDWSGSLWFYAKLVAVLGLTWFHLWLGVRRKDFLADANRVAARRYRFLNEVVTVLMFGIIVMVIVKPF